MVMRTWASLRDPLACSLELAGGKASVLARLAQDGYPVPPGAVLFLNTDCTEESAREVLRLAGLQDAALAVRSSAVFEDGADKSWAGQFLTVLDVQGGSAVTRAVAGVRASYLKAQASIDSLKGPVLLHRQINARLSGVCFTADPGSGIRSLTVVEGVRGQGEALVSGRVDPFYIRIDRRTDEAVSTRGFAQETEDGRVILAVARQVAELGYRAERTLLAGPLDIEWTWDGRQLWLLQARPVTTPTFPLPDREPLCEPEVWFHGNFAETMPGPVPPLAWDILREATLRQTLPLGAERLARALHADLIECLGGRVCWNVSFLSYWGALRGHVLDLLALIDAGMAASIRKLHDQGVLVPRREPGAFQRGRFVLSLTLLGGRILLDMAHAWRRGRGLAMEAMGASAQRLVARSGPEPVEALSMEESWRRARILCEETWPSLLPHIGTFKLLGLSLLFGGAAARWTGRSLSEVVGLVLDQEPSWARRMDDALRDLGRVLVKENVTSSDDLASASHEAQARLQAFMSAFGHRGPGEQDLSRPRFREQPGVVVDLALQAARQKAPRRADRESRARLLDEVRRRSALGRVRAAVLAWLAPRAAHWAPVREDAKHVFWMPVWDRLRALVVRIGTVLCEHGVASQADDVFLFTFDELDRYCTGRMDRSTAGKLVLERRRTQDKWRRLDLPYVIRSDGVPVELNAACGEDAWRGVPVSDGAYEGTVRVARSFEEALAVQPGEILISTHLDPGWTALFSRTGALVMEVGGVVSHAAVIARELGIPAVAGVMGATRVFRNGEHVRVDGRTGMVTRAVQPLSSK